MGDQKAFDYKGDTTASPEFSSIINNANASLPSALSAITESIQPYEQAVLSAQQSLLPQYNQGMIQLAQQYAPQLNDIYQQIAQANQASQVASEANLAKGAGKDLISANLDNAKLADPEYYQTRATAASKLNDLLAGYNPNGLSNSEFASAERSINRMNEQSGLGNLGTNTGAIANALSFDDRLQSKRSALSQALSLVPSNLSAFKSGTDTSSVSGALSRTQNQYGSGISNLKSGDIGSTSSNLMNSLLGYSTELNKAKMGQIAQINSSFNAADDNNVRDYMDAGIPF